MGWVRVVGWPWRPLPGAGCWDQDQGGRPAPDPVGARLVSAAANSPLKTVNALPAMLLCREKDIEVPSLKQAVAERDMKLKSAPLSRLSNASVLRFCVQGQGHRGVVPQAGGG